MASVALARPSYALAPSAAPTRARAPWIWQQRSFGAAVGLALTIIGAVVAVLAASLIGPFIMFVAPLILVFGCALGPLHAMVRGEL